MTRGGRWGQDLCEMSYESIFAFMLAERYRGIYGARLALSSSSP